jgi:hypothetical protein
LEKVMNNEQRPVDLRLKAARELQPVNTLRLTGQGSVVIQSLLSLEDAMKLYKRTLPFGGNKENRQVQADDEEEFLEDELKKDEKVENEFEKDRLAFLDVAGKCVDLTPTLSDLFESNPATRQVAITRTSNCAMR